MIGIYGYPGWTCTKCERIYSPNTQECLKCNSIIDKKFMNQETKRGNEVLRTHEFRGYGASCKSCGWNTYSSQPHNCKGFIKPGFKGQ